MAVMALIVQPTATHEAIALSMAELQVTEYCTEDVLPQQDRLERVTDASDLAEVYETERHLLYVACTRAREHLLVTGIEPGSEFLEDLENQ